VDRAQHGVGRWGETEKLVRKPPDTWKRACTLPGTETGKNMNRSLKMDRKQESVFCGIKAAETR
jgi:hypothetical protein